jgi:hypothetical protein
MIGRDGQIRTAAWRCFAARPSHDLIGRLASQGLGWGARGWQFICCFGEHLILGIDLIGRDGQIRTAAWRCFAARPSHDLIGRLASQGLGWGARGWQFICCFGEHLILGIDLIGRDGQIRTADPSHPKRVLYQAEPRPDDRKVLG